MLNCSSFHLEFYLGRSIFFLNRNPLGQVLPGGNTCNSGCFVSVKSYHHGFSHQRLWHRWTLESSSTAVECNVVYRFPQRKPIHKRYPVSSCSKTPLDLGNFPHEKIRRKSSHAWEWNHCFCSLEWIIDLWKLVGNTTLVTFYRKGFWKWNQEPRVRISEWRLDLVGWNPCNVKR